MVDETERYAAELLASDYASWRYCIEAKCGLALTLEFLKVHITLLGDPRHEETLRFASLYGDCYREQALAWFRCAAAEG
ncbi:MAG: hypothetical protein QNK18_09730 [Gammaproteobacteria bacterium]|nr:hypothetical protein [Gammaproteobacteria bacterium]